MEEEKQLSSTPSNTDESIAMEEVLSSLASKKDSDSSDEATTTCPLFMTGLPRDFSTNPQLAALASLLDDDDDDDDNCEEEDVNDKQSIDDSKQKSLISVGSRLKTVAMPSRGGGKVLKEKSRMGRLKCQGAPYDYYPRKAAPSSSSGEEAKNNKKNASTSSSSLGEAQLFLNMWKL